VTRQVLTLEIPEWTPPWLTQLPSVLYISSAIASIFTTPEALD
jgi:hypothetical protein